MINTELLDVTVENVMSKDLKSIGPFTTMKEVDEIFKGHNFHHLPIIDENKMLLGMISKYDLQLLKHWGTKQKLDVAISLNEKILSSQFAKDFMSRSMVTVSPSNSLEYCALAFKENRFHSLPVVENEKLVGIITTFDLINVAYL